MMPPCTAVTALAFAAVSTLVTPTQSVGPPPPAFPYNGRFTGDNPGTSCGDEPARGDTNLPKYGDCMSAAERWRVFQPGTPPFDFSWGGIRTWEVQKSGTCAILWYPVATVVDHSVWNPLQFPQIFKYGTGGYELESESQTLIGKCQAGEFEKQYVSRFSYTTVPNLGTFSIWLVTDVEHDWGEQAVRWGEDVWSQVIDHVGLEGATPAEVPPDIQEEPPGYWNEGSEADSDEGVVQTPEEVSTDEEMDELGDPWE